MATAPNSILARGTASEDDWYNEINRALEGYQKAFGSLMDPEADEMQIMMRLSFANSYRKELSRHGITVCGDFGHA